VCTAEEKPRTRSVQQRSFVPPQGVLKSSKQQVSLVKSLTAFTCCYGWFVRRVSMSARRIVEINKFTTMSITLY